LTKECSAYTGLAGDYCTVIQSNVNQVPVGSRVYYLVAADLEQGTYDGDVELRVKHDHVAFGHVIVTDLFSTIPNTVIGTGSFSGGTGRFKGFHAQIVISVDNNPLFADWDGTYSFSRKGANGGD
jgi:cephalosporin hydroxylase